jgi:DNA-binding NarL/FixJ family response regulator
MVTTDTALCDVRFYCALLFDEKKVRILHFTGCAKVDFECDSRVMVSTSSSTKARHPKRVLVVDDDPTFRAILRAILARFAEVGALDESGDAEGALEKITAMQPDLVVVDWLMPGLSGLDLIRAIRSRSEAKQTRILLCTAHPSQELANDLFTLRVNGYVDKNKSFAVIEAALGSVLNGGLFYASKVGPNVGGTMTPFPSAAPRLPEAAAIAPSDRLSKRESEIARLVAGGMISKEIAARLGISQRTVESHRANLMRKIGVSDVATLTRWAMRTGLLGRSA